MFGSHRDRLPEVRASPVSHVKPRVGGEKVDWLGGGTARMWAAVLGMRHRLLRNAGRSAVGLNKAGRLDDRSTDPWPAGQRKCLGLYCILMRQGGTVMLRDVLGNFALVA